MADNICLKNFCIGRTAHSQLPVSMRVFAESQDSTAVLLDVHPQPLSIKPWGQVGHEGFQGVGTPQQALQTKIMQAHTHGALGCQK